MNDNDLIRRGDAESARNEILRTLNYINSSGCLDYADYRELFGTINREFDALKAVPQEMNAREYIREHRRMCYFYFGKPATDGGLNVCGGCPFRKNGGKGCWIKPGRSESSIAIVEKWAREHPERSEK